MDVNDCAGGGYVCAKVVADSGRLADESGGDDDALVIDTGGPAGHEGN